MNVSSGKSTDKIGAGRALNNRFERKFKRGSLMFIEGETSTEMYILQSGKVRILKQEGEKTVELAVLGAGSVLGELALLDHQPRSATAQVVEDVTATVIDEDLLHTTLEKTPAWLASIIQVVVKRLRDTMKRTSDDIVRRSIAGVIRVILLVFNAEAKNSDRMLLTRIKDTVYSTIGLGDIETENVFLHLILKDMALIRKNDMGQEFLILKDRDVLQLYMSFLRAQQQGTSLVGSDFTAATVDLLTVIMSTGQKAGKKIQEKLIRVESPQVELELDRAGKGRFMDLDALDQLVNSKVIAKEEGAVGTHKRIVLTYNTDTLERIRRLQQWLPTFKEEIKF